MKKILIIIVVLCLISSVWALDCEYDTEPYLTKSIDFKCITNNSDYSKCFGMVFYGDELINVYPKIDDILLTGRIQHFESQNNSRLLNVQFGNKDLYQGNEYLFKVLCASLDGNDLEEFNVNLTPSNKEYVNVLSRFIWARENMSVIFGVIILLFLIAGFIYWIKN